MSSTRSSAPRAGQRGLLPEAFARDEERMKRFEREAQVLASLNYPSRLATEEQKGGTCFFTARETCR